MSQLTDISVTFRKIALWTVIGIAALIVLNLFVRFLISTIRSMRPAPVVQVVPTPTPDTRFGKLPYPKFSVIDRTSAGLNLRLVNIEGRVPETSGSAKIFSMPKKLPTLLTNDRAGQFASQLGFTGEPQIIDSRTFKFTSMQNPLRMLILERVHLNFSLTYDYASNSAIFSPIGTIGQNEALSTVQGYAASLGRFDNSILGGKITQEFLDFDEQTRRFKPVGRSNLARAARVHFFRKDIDGRSVVPPGFDESFNYAIYTDTRELPSGIIELSYAFWPVAEDDFTLYPLRTSTQAWEELKEGFGSVVDIGKNTPDDIIVRKIFIAYLDTPEPQQFLQPIFVFEGDNGFVAYLPAITKEWLE